MRKKAEADGLTHPAPTAACPVDGPAPTTMERSSSRRRRRFHQKKILQEEDSKFETYSKKQDPEKRLQGGRDFRGAEESRKCLPKRNAMQSND